MVFLLVSRAVPPLGGPRTAPERSAGAARAAKAQRGDERLFDSQIFEHREVREVCTQTCTVSVVPGSCVRMCGVGGGSRLRHPHRTCPSTLTVKYAFKYLVTRRCRAKLGARVSTLTPPLCADRCAFSAPSARAIPSLPAARANMLPRNVWEGRNGGGAQYESSCAVSTGTPG